MKTNSLRPLTFGLQAFQQLGVHFAEQVHHLGFGGSARAPHLPPLRGSDPAGLLLVRVGRSAAAAGDRHDDGRNFLVRQQHPRLAL